MQLTQPSTRIAITGHRPKDFSADAMAWTRDALSHIFTRLHNEYASTQLLCGMAIGVDQWAATIALGLGMRLDAYLPFPAEAQTLRWNSGQRNLHTKLLAQAFLTFTGVTELPAGPSRERTRALMEGYSLRNTMMVETCDVVVAVSSMRPSGGTAHAIREAVIHSKPLILANLRTRTISIADHDRLAAQFDVTRPVSVS